MTSNNMAQVATDPNRDRKGAACAAIGGTDENASRGTCAHKPSLAFESDHHRSETRP